MSKHDTLCRLGFVWEGEIIAPNGQSLYKGPPTKNIIPQVGINHLVGLIRGTGTPISAWYVGVGEGDVECEVGLGGDHLIVQIS